MGCVACEGWMRVTQVAASPSPVSGTSARGFYEKCISHFFCNADEVLAIFRERNGRSEQILTNPVRHCQLSKPEVHVLCG